MYGVAAVLQAGGAVSVVRPDPRTGRLVRTVVRTEPRPAAKPSGPLKDTVDRIAIENQLSPALVHSVIQVESNYQADAVSPKGAQGLMQLIPETAKRFGVSNAFDAADNIQGGARYLKYLLELYKGDQALALAAYNAGEGAVARYKGIPPYAETRKYVDKVRQKLAAGPVAATAITPEPVVEAPPAEVHNPIREVVDARGRIYYTSR